jgi:hypothetical protein
MMEKFISIEGDGKDCFIVKYPSGETKKIPNCDAIKLARTLFNKPGIKYSRKQMKSWGFNKIKEVI